MVELILDLCAGGSIEDVARVARPVPDAPSCRIAAPLPGIAKSLQYQGALQLGGITRFWNSMPSFVDNFPSLKGCIRKLRVNGEVRL